MGKQDNKRQPVTVPVALGINKGTWSRGMVSSSGPGPIPSAMGKVKHALNAVTWVALLFASVGASGMTANSSNVPKPVPTASFERYSGGLERSLKSNVVAKVSKSTPFDSTFTPVYTVFHTPSVSYWGGSDYQLVNVSSDDKVYRLDALSGSDVLSSVDFVVPGRGVLKGTLQDLFVDYFSQEDVDVDAIDMFRVSVDVPEFGKSFGSATYEFKDRNEASSVSFVTDRAYHRLSVDHVIPGSQMEASWWQGQDVNNVSDVPIDVVFEGDDGSSYILVEDLQPGNDMTFLMRDLLGLDHSVVSGDFVSYVSDGFDGEVTGDPVDAITGLSVFGWRNGGYGLSEGLEQVGSFVDGSNDFRSSWSIPTGVVESASSLNNDGNNWIGVAYRNVSSEDQQLVLKHYGLDGTNLGTVFVDVPAGKKVAFLPEDFGFDSSVPGSLEMVVDGVGSSIYLVGDVERSFMGGSMSPSVLSDYVEVPTLFNGSYSGVLSIMNPGDEATTLDVLVHDQGGSLLSTTLQDIVIPAHGSYVTDLDFLNEGFSGKLSVQSDLPVRVVLNEYSISGNKNFVNMNGKLGVPVNGPVNTVDINYFEIDGNRDTPYVNIDGRASMIANVIASGDPIAHADIYVDGEFVSTRPVGNLGGNLGFAFDLDPGDHIVRLDIYQDDGNDIVDGSGQIIVKEVPGGNRASFTYFDMDHNPTDTLHANEPFYVHYKLENFTGEEIDGVDIVFAPNSTGPTRLTLDDIGSGQSLEGEAYVESGIDGDASDVVDKFYTPASGFNYVGSDDWHSNVYETGEYTLAAEPIYDNIPNYDTITADSIDELAEITSREGVLIGNTTQLTYEEAYNGWTTISNSSTFDGITLDTLNNLLRIHYNNGDSDTFFNLGGQTYFAENNEDDLKVVYNLDQQ